MLDFAELTIGRAEIGRDGDLAGCMPKLVGLVLGLQQESRVARRLLPAASKGFRART